MRNFWRINPLHPIIRGMFLCAINTGVGGFSTQAWRNIAPSFGQEGEVDSEVAAADRSIPTAGLPSFFHTHFNGGDESGVRFADEPRHSGMDALTVIVCCRSSGLAGSDGGIVSKSADSNKFFGSDAAKVWEIGILNDESFFQVSNGSSTGICAVTYTAADFEDGDDHLFAASWHAASGAIWNAMDLTVQEGYTNSTSNPGSMQAGTDDLQLWGGRANEQFDFVGDGPFAIALNRFTPIPEYKRFLRTWRSLDWLINGELPNFVPEVAASPVVASCRNSNGRTLAMTSTTGCYCERTPARDARRHGLFLVRQQ